jgi:hypothetical protein
MAAPFSVKAAPTLNAGKDSSSTEFIEHCGTRFEEFLFDLLELRTITNAKNEDLTLSFYKGKNLIKGRQTKYRISVA